MNIKEMKIKAFEDLFKNQTVSKEKLLELINDNIEKGKITEEDIKHIKEQL